MSLSWQLSSAWLKPLDLKAVTIAANVTYPYFTWKQYPFFELSRDPCPEKMPKVPVRPNSAYDVLFPGIKHKTYGSLTEGFIFTPGR